MCAHVSVWVPMPVTCMCGGQRFIWSAFLYCPSASFKDLFIFICKFECLYACMHTITCMSGAYRDKKRASDHLELQLQVVVSCLFMGNRNSIQVLRQGAPSALNCQANTLAWHRDHTISHFLHGCWGLLLRSSQLFAQKPSFQPSRLVTYKEATALLKLWTEKT